MKEILNPLTASSIRAGSDVNIITRVLGNSSAITNPDVVQNSSYTNEQMVLNCINYIDKHFTEPLSLSSISHMAAVSESTLCNCFKKLTGYTFHTYINRLRIQYATSLIKKGHKITAVSTFCGYNDFSTFSRNFKKIIGISPMEYHKQDL